MIILTIPTDRPAEVRFRGRTIRLHRGHRRNNLVIETEAEDVSVNERPLFRTVEMDAGRDVLIDCDRSRMRLRRAGGNRFRFMAWASMDWLLFGHKGDE